MGFRDTALIMDVQMENKRGTLSYTVVDEESNAVLRSLYDSLQDPRAKLFEGV